MIKRYCLKKRGNGRFGKEDKHLRFKYMFCKGGNFFNEEEIFNA